MYISTSNLRVSTDRAAELITAFRHRAHAVEQHDGFVDLEIWQSDRDEGQILMISRWRDRDCFKAYMRSNDHRQSHERIDPDLKQAIKLESLEHMHTYEVVAQ
jgi:heme-degrading monooxygenase HmoA